MEQAYQQMQRKMRISKMDENIKHKIMVLSGKGGVGKSTVAANIACALANKEMQVGLLDLDIYGPSLPIVLGINEQPKSIRWFNRRSLRGKNYKVGKPL